MKDQKKRAVSMFRRDCCILAAFTVLAVCMVLFVLTQVLSVTDSGTAGTVLTVVAGVSCIALVGAILAVILHLRKNCQEIYGEDIHYQELIKLQKEGK